MGKDQQVVQLIKQLKFCYFFNYYFQVWDLDSSGNWQLKAGSEWTVIYFLFKKNKIASSWNNMEDLLGSS